MDKWIPKNKDVFNSLLGKGMKEAKKKMNVYTKSITSFGQETMRSKLL